MQQVIINNCREVGILEVVAVDGKPFLNLLLDEIIDDGKKKLNSQEYFIEEAYK